MAALYVTSGGRVVRAYSLADLNRMRLAQLRQDRQARAVERNRARRVRLALREARLDHQNAVRRAKLAGRRRRARYKEMERRLSHQAMLRRREARWTPRPARKGR